MKITQLLSDTANKLKKNPHSSANLEARLLVSHIFKIAVDKIFIQDDLKINHIKKIKLNLLIAKRVKGVPMAHLLGKREFYGYDFLINKHVLDPRCDSECMIDLIKEIYKNELLKKMHIIELGVGSGCLIISILNQFNLWSGIGVDISKKALNIAKKNCDNFNLSSRLKFVNSNLFAKIKSEQKFDIIISNPPYIPASEIKNLQNEVALYEPKIALDGGVDGLEFYRRIAKDSKNYLQKNGSIFLEIGHNQENEVIDIFANFNFYLQDKKQDLGNIVRILHFKLK